MQHRVDAPDVHCLLRALFLAHGGGTSPFHSISASTRVIAPLLREQRLVLDQTAMQVIRGRNITCKPAGTES